MAQLVVLVLAGVTGAICYVEAARFETQHHKAPLGFSARKCGIGACFAGLLVALFAAPLVLGAVVGYAAYTGAATFERQQRERLLNLSASLYAVAGFFFAAFGALFTSTWAWGILCLDLTLAGALLLLIDENKALTAETERLRAENAKRNTGPPDRSVTSSVPSAATPRPEPPVSVAQWPQQLSDPQPQHQPAAARKAYLFGPPTSGQPRTAQLSPGSAPPPSRWSTPHDRLPDDLRGTDLLPNRARPGTPRRRHANDFLPGRR